jgi:hypothetical protein
MNSTDIESLLQRLDGSGSDDEWAAAKELRTLGNAPPELLLRRYRVAREWKVRSSCVYHALRYARECEASVTLGREAIRDKSKVVRYRACMLLAYAQRKDSLPDLREAQMRLGNNPGADDVAAAIDAIESENQHYFVDRHHTGKMRLTIS